MTIKDCFQPGMTLDRVFTFRAVTQWGTATLERQGHVAPRRVRLSDSRDFAVRHAKTGLPVVDWTGLVKKSEVAGIKSLTFDMPDDGFASVVLRAADGTVARHLLNCETLSKGRHELKWDGLSTPNWKRPGEPVPAWHLSGHRLYHKGIGMRLNGWAANSGQTPWDYPAHKGNWGGDHGAPIAVAADEEKVYLGWTGAEAGKALVACDLEGRPVWNHTRGGIGGAQALAVDGGTVYVLDRITASILYRLDSVSGEFNTWQGRDTTELPLKDLFENFAEVREDHFSMAGGGGQLYLSSKLAGQIVVFDAATGAVQWRMTVPEPSAISISPSGRLYVVSGGTKVLAFDDDLGAPKTVLEGLTAATSIAVDAAGQMYVGCGDPDNQIKVFSPSGKLVKAIGRAGGRALVGPWTSDGVRFVDGLALDAAGKLWVMENDGLPKRVSVWNVETGAWCARCSAPTSYGAPGGAICPTDPLVVVGQGCEWRIDPKTGQAACTAVITRDGMENSRFATSARRANVSVRRQHRGGGASAAAHLPAIGRWPVQAANGDLSTSTTRATNCRPAARQAVRRQKNHALVRRQRRWRAAARRAERHRRRDAFQRLDSVGDSRQDPLQQGQTIQAARATPPAARRATTWPSRPKCRPPAWARPMAAWCSPGTRRGPNARGCGRWTSPAASSSGNIPTLSSEFTVPTTLRRRPKV